MILSKEIYSGISVTLTVIGFAIFIYTILRGKSRPHFFSWAIWAIITSTAFLAQLQNGAGVGSIPTGVSAFMCIVISILAYIKIKDIVIYKSDWVCFCLALSSIIIWLLTSTPIYSIILLILINGFACLPTLRKVWNMPYSENLSFHCVYVIRGIALQLSIENYNFITVAFPASVLILTVIFIFLILYRRANLNNL